MCLETGLGKHDNYDLVFNSVFLVIMLLLALAQKEEIKGNNNAFRLRRLRISGHPVLKDLEVTLCDDDDNSSSVYTTGIIGANGTGKSHLMGAIASIFTEIRKAIAFDNKGSKRFSFDVDFENKGSRYCVSNVWKKEKGHPLNTTDFLWATRDGHRIDPRMVALPERVIASTMTITDKFVAKSDSFYRYRGIRNEKSANTTGTRAIIRKTVESLMDCMVSKNAFQKELRLLLNSLELEEHLHVSYGMRYKDLFLRPDMSVASLRRIFDHWETYFPARENEPWGYKNYIRGLREDESALTAAAVFLSEKAKMYNNSSSVIVSYDVMKDPTSFYRDSGALRVLTQLDLVSFPSINVVKKGMSFGLENSSSGETHLLCQFIGIMANIRHNSLVLIDEPENSSHPDWQMNYVGWLREIFREYKDCHFIISTHSPLILANMKASESTIVRLRRGDNGISDIGGVETGCYSWTVDEILQDVMEMKSCRTKEFNSLMSEFEKAVDADDRERAQIAYSRLVPLIKPGNVLAELLRIQMIGTSR